MMQTSLYTVEEGVGKFCIASISAIGFISAANPFNIAVQCTILPISSPALCQSMASYLLDDRILNGLYVLAI
jgi:hypothetical protein